MRPEPPRVDVNDETFHVDDSFEDEDDPFLDPPLLLCPLLSSSSLGFLLNFSLPLSCIKNVRYRNIDVSKYIEIQPVEWFEDIDASPSSSSFSFLLRGSSSSFERRAEEGRVSLLFIFSSLWPGQDHHHPFQSNVQINLWKFTGSLSLQGHVVVRVTPECALITELLAKEKLKL